MLTETHSRSPNTTCRDDTDDRRNFKRIHFRALSALDLHTYPLVPDDQLCAFASTLCCFYYLLRGVRLLLQLTRLLSTKFMVVGVTSLSPLVKEFLDGFYQSINHCQTTYVWSEDVTRGSKHSSIYVLELLLSTHI